MSSREILPILPEQKSERVKENGEEEGALGGGLRV